VNPKLSVEESFENQELLRSKSEKKLEAIKEGNPLPGSLKEFMQRLETELAETPVLREFIVKEHQEMKETLSAVRNLYSQLLEENNVGVQDKIEDLITAISNHDHNFTFYANQMLSLTKEKNYRIYRTLDVLDAELKLETT